MQILLVDDHALFREGLGLLLRDLSAALEVRHASSVESALEAAQRWSFDLVLLDLALPGRSGPAALREFRRCCEEVPVVVLSSSDDRETVMAALDAGAMGYVPKSSSAALMIGALRIVLAGGIYLPPDVFMQERLGTSCADSSSRSATPPDLTPRQTETLRLILEGNSIKGIARALDVSENTAKTHVSAVLRALNVTTRTQAIVVAHRMQLRFAPR